MKISRIIFGFFALVAILFEAYFWIISLIGFFIQVILIASVSALFVYYALSRRQKSYGQLLRQGVFGILSVIGIFVSLFLVFIGYHTLVPASLSNITLSDGSGSVVYISMSHIATADFFDLQKDTIRSLADDGYTILMEWVTGWSPENQAKFDSYMGFQFTETLYDTVALLAWLESQSNESLYAGISTGALVSVDLSIDDIVNLIGDTQSTVSGEIVDIERDLSQALEGIGTQEQSLLALSFRALLSWSLKNSWDIESALMQWDKAGVFRAIIEKRNDPIVKYIQEHPGQKIAIVYGALHFNWVYAELQKLNANWKIQSIESIYPYK